MPQPVIQVPRPCAEKWDAMTPAPGGRHCAACQKVVVDFTQKTDAELLAYFQQQPSEAVPCGRFRTSQLGRPLAPAASPRAGSPWRAWLALLLAAWGTSQAEAATGPGPAATHHTPLRPTPRRRPGPPVGGYVHGTVRNAVTHEPLAHVTVNLAATTRRVQTDAAGRFRLALPARRPRGGWRLLLSSVGYHGASLPLPARPTGRGVRVALTQELDQAPDLDGITGGVPITEYYPDTLAAPRPVPPAPARATPARPAQRGLRRLFWR